MVADDMAYWSAHPELPGLVAHFMAKGEHPSGGIPLSCGTTTAVVPRARSFRRARLTEKSYTLVVYMSG